eukprot:7132674-Prymnesium_polylepis.1
MYYPYQQSILERCTVHSSSAVWGGGLFMEGGILTMKFCQFYGCTASHTGSSIYTADGGMTYILPAPKGHWVAGALCLVYRKSCDAMNYQPDAYADCKNASLACSLDVTDDNPLCTPKLFAQPCDWDAQPELVGETVMIVRHGPIDESFPFECSPGLVGDTYNPEHQSRPKCSGLCPAGNICPNPITVIPDPCKLGHYCPAGAAFATPCPSGTCTTVTDLSDAARCSPCRAGHWCALGREVACPEGTFNDQLGASSEAQCTACPRGTFNDKLGAANASQCESCPSGTYNAVQRAASKSQCTPCPPGTFSMLIGARSSQCVPCPAGSHASSYGATSCVACTPGEHQVSSGGTTCDDCTPGHYQPSSGSSTCLRCAAGSHMPSYRATSCDPCPPLQKQPGQGETSCVPCEPNTNSTPGAAACDMCREGTYRLSTAVDADSSNCQPCPAHATCPYNATVATLSLDDGYWRHSDKTVQMWRCKEDHGKSSCRGGADAGRDGNGYCYPDFEGPQCELCVGPSTYSRWFDKLTVECHGCGDVTLQAACVSAGLSLLLVLAVGGGRLTMRQQRCSKTFDRVTRFQKRAQTLWKRAGMRYKVKALVGLYQCVAAISSVYDVSPPAGVEEYTKWINIL